MDAGPYCMSRQADSKAITALVDAAQECRLSDTVNTQRPPAHSLRLHQQLTQRQFWDKVTRIVLRDQAARWGAGRCLIYDRKAVQLRQRQEEERLGRRSANRRAMDARHSRERKRLPTALSELATVSCGEDKAWTTAARKFARRELHIGINLVRLIKRFGIGALCIEVSCERSR